MSENKQLNESLTQKNNESNNDVEQIIKEETFAVDELPSKANKKRNLIQVFVIILLVVIVGVGFYVYRQKFQTGQGSQVKEAKNNYYCPMHPQYKAEKPIDCPICSMKLVKFEPTPNGENKSSMDLQSMSGMDSSTSSSTSSTSSNNTIYVDPQRQQLIGVQFAKAISKPLSKEIRIVGKVSFDETKITHIHTKVTGYLENVFVDYVGKPVKKGDPLFTIYSPDLVATEQEYLLALRSNKELSKSSFKEVSFGSSSLLEATRNRLKLWDISDKEIEELEREGKAKRELTFYSPVDGVVTERAAYGHGKFVNPEMDLYSIVDLSTIWIIGEVYEYEMPLVKLGQTIEIEMPYSDNKSSRTGKITYIYPFLDPKTRTGKIRIEFTNPQFSFKPDMFVNMKVKINLGTHLVVPEDAVMDTGQEQYVFVDKGGGYFEPRPVKIGTTSDGYYVIESGLEEGEQVVTAANFILDSESRLKGAFANMGKPDKEMQKTNPSTSNLNVEVIEPKVAKVGKNTIRLSVKDASGSPVTDGDVDVTLFMPQMGSMAPMSSSAKLKSINNGEYSGEIDFPMAWTWQTTITVKKAGQSLGSTQTNITAR
ncbi:MAG: efflux RND transporter periplasmic adaptor subunit [Blastocatellia bacterium]